VGVGLWNYIRLPARDGPILVLTARCFTGTVHTIAASLHESPLAIQSLLKSLLESLLERATTSGGVEFSSTGSLWLMANYEFVEALADRSL